MGLKFKGGQWVFLSLFYRLKVILLISEFKEVPRSFLPGYVFVRLDPQEKPLVYNKSVDKFSMVKFIVDHATRCTI